MTKLYIDIETYSATDLKVAGVYRYAEDPTFEILMAGWVRDDDPIGEVQVAIGREEIDKIPGLFDPAILKVAHNAQFERICFSRFYGGFGACLCGGPSRVDPWDMCNDECGSRVGTYYPIEEWHDTAAIAAEKGYPRKLEHLGRFFGGEQKDSAGAALIRLFCMPNKKGERNRPEDYPEKWAQFVEYCRQDVVTLRDVDERLGDWPTEMERRVYLSDQRINDEGMKIDLALCQGASAAIESNAMRDEMTINQLTGGVVTNPASLQQMGAWLKSTGLTVPNLRAETIEGLLQDDLDPVQRRVLELRQELALASVKKFPTALAQVSADGRLRGRYQFFGAHTGRWAGRGAQPQNLPRLAFDNEVDAELAILETIAGETVTSDDLKRLVRAMFTGPFTVVDYAAIEARVVAWLAGEQWALEAFRAGRDIYVETAERMSTPTNRLTRSHGKIAVLALGYNGGINSLRNMGGEGTDTELQRLVYQWRDANPTIVDMWRKMGEAFRKGGPVGDGHLRIDKDGTSRHLVLPSGRAISYHRCSFKMEDGQYGPRWAMDFADPVKVGMRTRTYGGRLTENATQAVARDILAEALVRLHEQGYRIVGHVHDEVLVEGVGWGSVEAVSSLMCIPPKWADGLPIDAEGFTSNRYRKG